MRILAVDCSAKTASAAIVDESAQIISESFVNAGLTHSETLLPIVDCVLSTAELSIANVDVIAVTHGPGSFTGIRIGIAAVKGLAMPYNTPCCGVSTLKAMAYNLIYEGDCIACCAMDARCGQVYFAAFRCRQGKVDRLTQDCALPANELIGILSAFSSERIVCVGDGAPIAFEALRERLPAVQLACGRNRFQCACGAACVVAYEKPKLIAAGELTPVYLRLSQAERELKLRKAAEN